MVAERAKKLRQQQAAADAEARVVSSDGPAGDGPAGDGPAGGGDRPKRRPIVVDTCHAWRADGPLVERYMPAFYTGAKTAAD
jgi:hypothetical protein